jgi:hypothetical protein
LSNVCFFSFPIIITTTIFDCSTAEFRNAFLKTIRQIIRESVRNMSIPPAKPPVPSASTPPTPKAEAKGTSKGKRNVQRHSAGTIDYDNVESCGGGDTDDNQPVTFRGRSNTIGMLNSKHKNYKLRWKMCGITSAVFNR